MSKLILLLILIITISIVYKKDLSLNSLENSRLPARKQMASIHYVDYLDVLKNHLVRRIRSAINLVPSRQLRSLYLSFMGGSRNLDRGTKAIFRNIGILHLAVISGLHMMIIYGTVYSISLAPTRWLYIIGFVNHRLYEILSKFAHFVSMFCCILFCWLISFPAPCQRALLFIGLGRFVGNIFQISLRMSFRLPLIGAIQFMLFPSTFFSQSNFLSWSITIIIISQTYKKTWLALLSSQLYIFVFCALVFSRAGFVSIFVNLLGQWIFPVLISSLFIGIIGVILETPLHWIFNLQQSLLDLFAYVNQSLTQVHLIILNDSIRLGLVVLLTTVLIIDLEAVLRRTRVVKTGGDNEVIESTGC